MAGSTVILIDNNKVLMQLRSDNKSWAFPGGCMELGEKVEDTAIREVLEETGLKIDNLKLFDVFSGEELHYIYPNGDEVYNVEVVFITYDYSGDIVVDKDECLDVKFFEIEDIPKNISPPSRPAVMEFIRRYNEKLL